MHKFGKAETFRDYLETTMGQTMAAAEIHSGQEVLNLWQKVRKTGY